MEIKLMSNGKRKPDFEVFVVEVINPGDKGYWTKVGAAWSNKDQKGISVQLSALPKDGRLVLRRVQEKENSPFADEFLE
jgi:hypothetical protein